MVKSAGSLSIWRSHTLLIFGSLSLLSAGLVKWAWGLFESARHDAWLSVLLTGIAAMVLGSLVVWAVSLYPDARPGHLFVTALGSWLGGFLSLGFVLYCLAEAARAVQTAVELLHFAVLPRTPGWALSALGLTITAVLLLGGIESLLRFQFIVFWPGVFLAVATMGLGLRFADWANFLPVLSRGITPVIQGSGAMFEPVLGVALGFVYLPYFLRQGVGGSRALYALWGGTALTFTLYLYITVALLVGFGPFETASMTWPEVEAVRRTFLAGLFFERLDLLFLISLMLAASAAVNLYAHAGLETLRQLFSLRPRSWQVWACLLAVWGIGLIPSNMAQAEWWRDRVLDPLGLVFIIPTPLIMICLGLVRRNRRRSRAFTS